MILKFILQIFKLIFLWPFSFLWESIYRIRRFLYSFGYLKSYDFQVPIISVGNLTFGGTGKTPFILWLAGILEAQGKKVMILTRGYKGALEHSSGILHSGRKLGFNPFVYGDEATMLIRHLKNTVIVVGKKRSENLSYYFQKELPDVVLLDDGHQHLRLKRDLNIVLFDSLMSLDRYHVAPSGYLREGMSALQDADVVVLGRVDQVNDYKLIQLKEMLKKNLRANVPIVSMLYAPVHFENSSYEKVFDRSEIAHKKVIALAGVAAPESFFKMLYKMDANVIDELTFPDHHDFSLDDVDDIIKKAEEEDAYIVTTEKDIVKLRRVVTHPRIIYLYIKVDFVSGIEELQDSIKGLNI